ncbi:MAG TPA: transporter substrate-binding domain-containing protein [Chlamydiales bacterium]|nr:transporter substrate-binding domain-containing protein [Chlamydiales bacterium]
MKSYFLLLLLGIQAFANQEPLVVGTTSGYAPYVSINAEGKYEGFDIDLAEMLAKRLGRKLVIKDCGSMPGLMLALKQGKVDVLIWAVSITEERMKTLEMVYYQGEKVTKLPIFFWKEIPEGIGSLEDLAKKGVCVEGGSFQEAVLKSIPGIPLKYMDKIDDAIMDVKYGKSVAGTIDTSLLPRVKAQYPEIRILELPIPGDKQSLGNGICIAKDRQALASQVKQAVKELTAEGKIGELEKKWKMVE